jgi:hypothetical protein
MGVRFWSLPLSIVGGIVHLSVITTQRGAALSEQPSQSEHPPSIKSIVSFSLLALGICVALTIAFVFGGAWFAGTSVKAYWFSNWGNVTSVIGVLISVVGFVYTVLLAREAVVASKAARKAADEAKKSVYNFDCIVQLTNAISLLEQIKESHRKSEWVQLPRLYSETRGSLVTLTGGVSRLDGVQKNVVASVLVHLNDIDEKIEAFNRLQRAGEPAKSGGWLSLLKAQSDKLTLLQADLRLAQGEK